MFTQEGVVLWTANLDLLVKCVEWGGGALVPFVIWWRTNSFHYLIHRIFQGLGATKAFHSETAQRHWNDYEDLQQHNLWHGLRLSTSGNLKKFLSWLDSNDLSIGEICRAKWFFNANKLIFHLPSLRRRLAIGLILIVGVGIVLFFAGVLREKDSALIKVKQSGVWFWVNADRADGFRARLGMTTWHLDSSSCLFSDAPPLPLTEWDMQVICHLVLGNESEYVQEAIRSQNTIGLIFGILGIAFILWMMVILKSFYCAQALFKQIEEKKLANVEIYVR